MRSHVTLLSGLAVACMLARAAAADPHYQRYAVGVGELGLEHQFADFSQRPGPAVTADLMTMPWDAPVAIGAHVGLTSGWNHEHDASNTPHDVHFFDQLVQLDFLMELRQGPVALGAGLGLALYHQHVTSISDDAQPYRKTRKGFDGMVQLSIDVGAIDRGTFAVVGTVDKFPVLDLLEVVSGGEASSRPGGGWMVGVSFRPR